MQQRGFGFVRVLIGVVIVCMGLFLTKDSRPSLRLQNSLRSTTLPVRMMFITKGTDAYCQQFSIESCPRQYCELGGPSCPMCNNVGGCVSKKPVPTVESTEGKSCGGFAGEKGQAACPSGYKCQYPEPVYPDAQGKCIKL